MLENLGAQALKGVADPMVVYRVLGLRRDDPHAPPTLRDGIPLLVGRDEALGLLRRRWEQSTEGLGQVVLLSGEAGIGKSALVEVLRAQVAAAGRALLFAVRPITSTVPSIRSSSIWSACSSSSVTRPRRRSWPSSNGCCSLTAYPWGTSCRCWREVVQLGAVLGREFAYEMLRALAAIEEPTLQDGLTQLVGAELLYQRGRPPRATYMFKHALVQDAAYQSLL